jgi:DNA modification methylase
VSALLTITVGRNPLSEGSVAKNALKWGTGGFNIDGSRIAGVVDNCHRSVGLFAHSGNGRPQSEYVYKNEDGELFSRTDGRWPANLIFQHKLECERIGTKKVKSQNPEFRSSNKGSSPLFGLGARPSGVGIGYANADGTEEVDAWDCEPRCPVVNLDEQSGSSRSTGGRIGNAEGVYSKLGSSGWSGTHEAGDPGYGDMGGASRFFKQVQGEDMNEIPADLVSYLATMIAPPDPFGAPFYISDLAIFDWDDMATWTDSSVTGIIARGTPTEEQSVELMRVLTPGAHLLLIAPDEQPTGHTGACRIEDVGFEIRDAILLAQEAGALFYVPKASRSEREAGCWGLQGKSGAEAVDREEGSAGMDSPRAGAGRTANRVKNHHPTVKPIDIMAACLHDVSEDKVVGDPFMGSGTTGVACVRTGHDFVGIEREDEYLAIADARVRYWRTQEAGLTKPAEVESDLKDASDDIHIDKKPESTTSLMDLFWEE